ncbi:MAG TPA: hypothetical protein VEK38_02700 [Candidatus Bathyarchaeia archaeon]|nr:hypothetical protein [Candidatus Bathyarchaeia archaeon]
MHDNNFSHNAQLAISYELLCLLSWLTDHDSEKLKKLITKALASGLQKKIQQIDHHNQEELYHSIIDFFNLLESLLDNAIKEQIVQQAKEKKLLPAIDQIDTTICTDAIVQSSLEKATVTMEDNPEKNPKEVLFNELLKRWKPHNKYVN